MCAPERLPKGEYTMAIPVAPMANPIKVRRRKAPGSATWTGDPGYSSRLGKKQAEAMNVARPMASNRYSGQWVRSARPTQEDIRARAGRGTEPKAETGPPA